MLTHLQPYLGSPPGTSHYDSLWLCHLPRALQIPRLPQHSTIPLRRPGRLRLPPLRLQTRCWPRSHLPHSKDHRPSPPGIPHLFTRLSFRLRIPRPHRLHNLHPRKIMQAPPRHVPAHNTLPKALSPLQIPRCPRRNNRSSSLHSPRRGRLTQETLKSLHKP